MEKFVNSEDKATFEAISEKYKKDQLDCRVQKNLSLGPPVSVAQLESLKFCPS
jgi:hypothetical protein